MNFNLSKSKVIPHSIRENDIRDIFLNFVIQGNNTPIDIALKAEIAEIKQLFYPVRCYDVTYCAEWNATSIWEHKESYTEYKSKTIYIDRFGKEHDKPGADYTDPTGKYGASSLDSRAKRQPWTPQQKIVPITKNKTIVDNIEQTHGTLGPLRFFQPIMLYENNCEEKLSQWIASSIKEEVPSKYINPQMNVNDIVPLIGTDKEAESILSNIIKLKAQALCSREVPGTRYKNFTSSIYDTNFTMEIVLVPIYLVTYLYQGNSFHCWINGKQGDVFYYSKPKDTNLAFEEKNLQDIIRFKKSSRFKWGALAFLVVPVALLITLFVAFAVSIAVQGNMGSVIFIFILGIAAECICVTKFLKLYHEVKDQKDFLENRAKNLTNQRKAIADIVRNKNMSEDEKQKAIQTILHRF